MLNLGKALNKAEQKSINGGDWMCNGELCTTSNPCSNGKTCTYPAGSEVQGCCGTISELQFQG